MSAPLSANAQAWLAMIRYAEGTAKYRNPYGTAFTGAQFDNSRPHPGVVRGRAGGWRSDASGAYQFLSTTWKGIWGGKNVPMTPENQDYAAIQLMKRRGVNPDAPITPEAMAKLAPEWASLPTLQGKSYYGQPVKGYADLAKQWNQAIGARAQMPLQGASNQLQAQSPQAQGGSPLQALADGLQGVSDSVGSFVQDPVASLQKIGENLRTNL